MQLLADTSRALTDSLDIYANFARLLRCLVASFADWCAVDLVEDGGQLTLKTPLTMLLDISRMPHKTINLDQRVCDLCALTERVADQIRVTLHQHTLLLEMPRDAVFVFGDSARLELVVRNLLQNAIQYSPRGGAISIRLARVDAQARLSIQDHGVGIVRDALPRIFGRFNRAVDTDLSTVTSMGIGLYVVKQIVELHGGSVAVQSVEGAGSTFTVHLPLHVPHVPASTAQ